MSDEQNTRHEHLPEGADVRHLEFGATDLSVEERDGEPAKITGYAAVFNRESRNLGGFVEIIEPGAFRDALPTSTVMGLFNHEPDNLLASEESGRLKLEEDERGLRFEMEPADTQTARDVMTLIDSGDLTGNSFSFTVKEDGDEVDKDTEPRVRRIKPGGIEEVYDVGPVTFPAYRDTVVSVRSRRSLDGEDGDTVTGSAADEEETQELGDGDGDGRSHADYARRTRIREQQVRTVGE